MHCHLYSYQFTKLNQYGEGGDVNYLLAVQVGILNLYPNLGTPQIQHSPRADDLPCIHIYGRDIQHSSDFLYFCKTLYSQGYCTHFAIYKKDRARPYSVTLQKQ